MRWIQSREAEIFFGGGDFPYITHWKWIKFKSNRDTFWNDMLQKGMDYCIVKYVERYDVSNKEIIKKIIKNVIKKMI